MSERHTGPVSQTLRASGSTYRRRIGSRGRAGKRDKRRIADGVRCYDVPGNVLCFKYGLLGNVDRGCDFHRIMALQRAAMSVINSMNNGSHYTEF